MELEEWDKTRELKLGEERLLVGVRRELGAQVKQLMAPHHNLI
jgi:hypothetical protein